MDHNTDAIATLPRAFYGLEINNPELFGLTYEVEKFNKNGQTVDIGYVVQCFDDRYQTLMPSLQEYDLTAINLQFEEEKKDEIEHSYHCVFRGKDFVSVAIGIDFLAAVYAAAYSSLPDFKAMLHQFEKILPLSMQFAKGLCNCLNEFNFLKLGCLADAALIRNEDWKSQVKIKQELLASYLQRKIEGIVNCYIPRSFIITYSLYLKMGHLGPS